MQVYLVVIDSTKAPRNVNVNTQDGPNQRNFSLTNGIQNFYFIMAKDGETAKKMVINTFRAKPAVMHDVSRCITATPLNAITKMLNQKQNVWSYIPIGGVRAPGQQGVNDTLRQIDKLNRMGETQEVSHREWQPPRPVTYDAQEVTNDELKGVRGSEEDMAVLNTNKTNSTASVDMNQMQQMMMQMQQMMMQMKTGQVPEIQPVEEVPLVKQDPNSDPELAARIRENMSPPLETVDDDVPEGEVSDDWVNDYKQIEP